MQWWIGLSEVLRNLGLIVAGAVGVYLAWLRVTAANRQAEAQINQAQSMAKQATLGQQKLITDLFSQAVAQLRDEKLELRLLAVYTLRQIALDHDDYTQAVTELLTAYVRENKNKWGSEEPPIDIREIFNTLGMSLEAGK